MSIKQSMARIVVGLLAALVCGVACAQDAFPSKPIRFLVGFTPGGSVDIIARTFAQKVQEALGQPVVVENRGGAGGALAANVVAKGEPDGYRILLENSGSFDQALLSDKVPYKVIGDFTPIAFVGAAPRVLAVGPSVAARDIQELVNAMRAKPGALSYGSESASSQLGLERLSRMADVKMLHVPFKGGADAMLAATAGQVDMTFLTVTTTLPQLRGGKLRPLAVSSLKRSSLLPDVPTLDESGFKGFEQSAWFGFVGPANMPRDVVEKLRAAIAAAANMPDVKEALAKLGVEVELKSPEQFGAFTRESAAQMLQAARDANIKIE